MGLGVRVCQPWLVDSELSLSRFRTFKMGSFTVVRPKDDAAARQSSDWCDSLCSDLTTNGHSKIDDVDDTSPPNTANIVAAIGKKSDLICYFGHGDGTAWLTAGLPTLDARNVS